jgi:hypothetical protein
VIPARSRIGLRTLTHIAIEWVDAPTHPFFTTTRAQPHDAAPIYEQLVAEMWPEPDPYANSL